MRERRLRVWVHELNASSGDQRRRDGHRWQAPLTKIGKTRGGGGKERREWRRRGGGTISGDVRDALLLP